MSSNTAYWRSPVAKSQRKREFTAGFCDLFGDCSLCMQGWCCLPCMVSENSAQLDNNENFCCCLYPSSTFKNRAQATAQFAIEEHWACCFAVCCFPCCSEIQIRKELNAHRGGVGHAGPNYQHMA